MKTLVPGRGSRFELAHLFLGLAALLAQPAAAQTGNPLTIGRTPQGASGAGGVASPSSTSQTPSVPTVSASQPLASTLSAGGPPPMVVQFAPAVVTANDGTIAPLYGTGLFTGAFAGASIAANANYVVQAGDTINVNTFGNVSLNVVGRVNDDGKLFLPVIGPVTVAGVARSQLNGVLQAAVASVYTGTQVYADILQSGAVGVFVTGLISRPGRYIGSPGDSPLYYLDKAGGIDGLRGSYRDILIRHADGRPDGHVDLYAFLARGEIGRGRLGDGDTIVVQPRGPLVVVTGRALNAYAFELKPLLGNEMARDMQAGLADGINGAGQQVQDLAKPNLRLVTGAYVRSVRNKQETAVYLPVQQFPAVSLGEGDHVEFRSDTVPETIRVTVQASLAVPSVYVVSRTATMRDVLGRLPQSDPVAEVRSAYVLRPSVAIEQKKLIEAGLLRLQADAFAARSLSPSAQAGQASNAELVERFVAAARQVVPDGKIAVFRDGRFDDIRLEDGDVVVVPNHSDVVLVAGEVLNPGAFAHHGQLRIRDYINDAGGFTHAADRGRYVLHKPNGTARVVDKNALPEPGDEILIVPEVRGQTFQLIKDISTLLFQIALSTATVLRL